MGDASDFIATGVHAVPCLLQQPVSDVENEFQMAGMHRYMLPDAESLFLTTSDQYQFISKTIVREIAAFGGDVSKLVFAAVERWLAEKIQISADKSLIFLRGCLKGVASARQRGEEQRRKRNTLEYVSISSST